MREKHFLLTLQQKWEEKRGINRNNEQHAECSIDAASE
jgi:hypothetical protein